MFHWLKFLRERWKVKYQPSMHLICPCVPGRACAKVWLVLCMHTSIGLRRSGVVQIWARAHLCGTFWTLSNTVSVIKPCVGWTSWLLAPAVCAEQHQEFPGNQSFHRPKLLTKHYYQALLLRPSGMKTEISYFHFSKKCTQIVSLFLLNNCHHVRVTLARVPHVPQAGQVMDPVL